MFKIKVYNNYQNLFVQEGGMFKRRVHVPVYLLFIWPASIQLTSYKITDRKQSIRMSLITSNSSFSLGYILAVWHREMH